MATTYRFYCLWNNGGAVSIDEITLHETLAGANIATSATATATGLIAVWGG